MTYKDAFDDIMHEITSGLTGDAKTDLAYLKEQCEAYKDHEMRTRAHCCCVPSSHVSPLFL